MRLRCLCAALILGSVPLPAHSQTGMGAGQQSCGSWSASRAAKDDVAAQAKVAMMSQWVLGYLTKRGLSGLSMVTPSISAALAKTDADGVIAWIDKQCREHPLDNVNSAALMLSIEMMKNSN